MAATKGGKGGRGGGQKKARQFNEDPEKNPRLGLAAPKIGFFSAEYCGGSQRAQLFYRPFNEDPKNEK